MRSIFDSASAFARWIAISVLSLLPEADLTLVTSINNNFSDFWEKLADVDFIWPVPFTISLIGFVISVEGTIMLYKMIHYVASKISARFSSS